MYIEVVRNGRRCCVGAYRSQLVDLGDDSVQQLLIRCILSLEVCNFSIELSIGILQSGELSLELGILGANFCHADWQDALNPTKGPIDASKQSLAVCTWRQHALLVWSRPRWTDLPFTYKADSETSHLVVLQMPADRSKQVLAGRPDWH